MIIHKKEILEENSQPMDEKENLLNEQIAMVTLQLGQLQSQRPSDYGNKEILLKFPFSSEIHILDTENHQVEINSSWER